MGSREGAADVFDVINKQDVPCYFPHMLCDRDRDVKMEEAIAGCIKSFKEQQGRSPRVLDVGAGTGVLSIYAAMHGASEVAAIEGNHSRAAIARKNVRKHSLCDKITVVCTISSGFRLEGAEPPFDVLVCELLGTIVHFERQHAFISDLFDRGVVAEFGDCRVRYTVPRAYTQWVRLYRMRDGYMPYSCVDAVCMPLARGCAMRPHHAIGLPMHTDALEPVGDQVCVVPWRCAWVGPVDKEHDGSDVTLVLACPRKDDLIVVEWRVWLWGSVYIENSITEASQMSAHGYWARMGNWGFFVCSPGKCDVTVRVTEDSIEVKKHRKR